MAGYIGSKAVLLSTTAATVAGNALINGNLTVDTDTLFVDSSNNSVGIGTSSPTQELDVVGTIKTTALSLDNVTVSSMVTAAEGIAANNNDTSIPTSAAVKAYADAAGYTDAQARTAQAGHSAGGVGSYMFARTVLDTFATYAFGATISGSSLRPVGIVTDDTDQLAGSNNVQTDSIVPAGTWRCMGRSVLSASGGGFNAITLWLRIS